MKNPLFRRLQSRYPQISLEALHRFEDSHVFPGCQYEGEPQVEFEPLTLIQDGHQLKGWCLNAHAKEGLLIFGGNNVPLAPLSKELMDHFPHHRIHLMPYPGYEGQPGHPSQESLTRFARSLYHLAKQTCHHVDVLGMSLGTGVATFLASHEKIRKLVLVTPYDSMLSPAKHLFPYLPVRLLMRQTFPSLQWLSAMNHCPDTLFLGSLQDATIPKTSTEKLFDGFKQKVEEFSKLLNRPIQLPDIAWFDVAHRDVLRAGAEEITRFLNAPIQVSFSSKPTQTPKLENSEEEFLMEQLVFSSEK